MTTSASFKFVALSLLAFFAALPSVSAHGYVKSVTIDGKAYQGNTPNSNAIASPIRMINDVDPVKGADNPFMLCGQGAALAQVVASANPGSSVAFEWASGTGGTWPHNTGPLMTYMAECTGTTCDKFNGTTAKWFKIDEAGQDASSGTWVQGQTYFEGKSYTVTLPKTIAPGDYLIRHEIIALQLAMSPGGAEFYPSCTQVRIGGTGNGVPSPADEVSFPGGYSDTDPGILDPNVYQPGSTYVFPGPPLSNLVSSSGGSGSNNSSAPSSVAASSPSSTPASASVSSTSATAPAATVSANSSSNSTTTSTGSSGTCKKKRMVKRAARHMKKHMKHAKRHSAQF